MKSVRFFVALVLVLALGILGACSTAPSEEAQETPTPTAVPSPTPTANAEDQDAGPVEEEPADAAPAEPTPTGPTPTPTPEVADRLVVQDRDFQLFTISPEGEDLRPLTDNDGTINTQPTWSPDGSSIAWTNFDPSTGISFIRTDRFDRSDLSERAVQSPPFYLSWDASSSRIAYLAPSRGGIDFGMVDLRNEKDAVRLDRGDPFWFSWGPLGDELLIHASNFRLDRIDIDDSTVVIMSEDPAEFQAPVWFGREGFVVYADEIDGLNYLLTSGTGGENKRLLATYDGYLIFTVNPEGSRVAYVAVVRDQPSGIITASAPPLAPNLDATTADGNPVAVSFQQPDPDSPFAFQPQPAIVNALHVTNTFGAEPQIVSFDQPLGFYWSPSNTQLAYLLPGPTPGSLQWWFWESNSNFGSLPGPVFLPSDTFATSYLPFFDQYEQNIEFWSPDGDRLVYAGTDPATGRSGIWTVEPTSGAVPFFVSEGEFAAWSPTNAGGASSIM